MRPIVALAIVLAGCAGPSEAPILDAAPQGALLVATIPASGRAELAVGVGPDDAALVSLVAAGYDAPRAWTGRAEGGGFAQAEPHDGPGDVDLASGANGVHSAGLAGRGGRVTAQRWAAGAWSEPIDVSAGAARGDRPFLDARGENVVVGWGGDPRGYQVALSRDGGRSFAPPVTADAFVAGTQGGVAVGPDGLLAVIVASEPLGVLVRISEDGGASWRTSTVARQTSWAWPSIAIDDEGVLHALWSTTYEDALPAQPVRGYGGELQPAPRVQYARSDDRGATWSTPRALAEAGHAAYYPWIAARAAGAVASWYDVEIGANDGRGRLMVAFLDGDGAELRTPTPEPVPMGFSCEDELRCREQGPVGESHDVAVRPGGAAAVAWLQVGPDGMEVWYASVPEA